VLVGLAGGLASALRYTLAHRYFEQEMNGLILLALRDHTSRWVMGGVLAAVLAFGIASVLGRLRASGRRLPERTPRWLSVPAAVAVTLIVALDLFVLIEPRISAPDGPNIVVIYLDALRPDHLGAYGYARETSPNIDSIAENGVLFRDVYAQSPATYPSVHSTLTSKYASSFLYIRKCVLERQHLTLAEILKNRGYRTVGISSSPIVVRQETHFALGGFEQGFDRFDDDVYSGDGGPWDWQFRSAEGVVDKAVNWLDDQRGGKFFLFLYIMDPHCDYRCPEPFNSRFDPDYDDKTYVAAGDPTFYEVKLLKGIDAGLEPRDIEHFEALYDGEIAYADAQIGRVLERLRQSDLADDTLIVFLSDHGEEFFEHGGVKHGYTLYDEVIRVPLIMSYPGVLPEGATIDDRLVQLLDVTPTILDVAGIPRPPFMQGASLLPLIDGEDAEWRDHAISEALFVDGKSIITDRWKYIHYYGTELESPYLTQKYRSVRELFDLQADPDETINLYETNRELAERLHARLLALIPERERDRVQRHERIEFDEETIRELKSLGYLQ
jgi:arylsulfatase A-like enzyme